MKRIAIFCDGTWNRSDAPEPTNVVRMALATARRDEAGVSQVPIYLPGVGSGRGATRIARSLDRLLGGALGWGVTENVLEAYRHLAFCYAPGDAIFIFGFSRGAFTARSLAGLIRSAAIPTPQNVSRIPHAVERYRSRARETHPDHPASLAFRRGFAPWLTTSQKERAWRDSIGEDRGDPLSIAYLGIWDTVGAMGIPNHYPFAAALNHRHAFHDHVLSRMVDSARHAVAIDERRRAFPPTLWNNVEDLNAQAPGKYLQHWFPGDHGSVGGGGDIHGLANHALLWIAEGARQSGLAFDERALALLEDQADCMAPLSNFSVPRTGLGARLTYRDQADRIGPLDPADVSVIARKRWEAPPSEGSRPYRPAALRDVAYRLGR